MSSRHHERIRRLLAWMKQHAHALSPLLAFHGSSFDTPQAEIDAAKAEGRPIANVRFVEATGDPRVMNREGESVTKSDEREFGSELRGGFTAALPSEK